MDVAGFVQSAANTSAFKPQAALAANASTMTRRKQIATHAATI
jgi:hypothetical protein